MCLELYLCVMMMMMMPRTYISRVADIISCNLLYFASLHLYYWLYLYKKKREIKPQNRTTPIPLVYMSCFGFVQNHLIVCDYIFAPTSPDVTIFLLIVNFYRMQNMFAFFFCGSLCSDTDRFFRSTFLYM